MRIAYITSRLPYPPIGGDRLRAYHFLRYLLRSHEVTLYALESGLRGGTNSSPSDLTGLKRELFRISPAAYGWNALKGLFSGLPLQVKLYENKALMQSLTTDVERGQIDLLFVHLVRMAEYARAFSSLPRILDMTDSIHLNYSRMSAKRLSPLGLAMRLDRARLARYEAVVPSWFDKILITSPVDLEWVRERAGYADFVLVPQGVELEKFPMTEGSAESNSIVFFGKLDTLPNTDAAIHFARDIFPQVKALVRGARFVVVGWNPPRAIRALARMPDITVRANVSDIRSEVVKAAVSVVPMRFSAGFQTKIIESLALGVPVVASVNAAKALGNGQTPGVLTGRTPEEFAGHVARVLSDRGYREGLRRAGRGLVESEYQWEKVLAPLEDVLTTVSVRKAHK